jgi:chemotaxis protein MotB
MEKRNGNSKGWLWVLLVFDILIIAGGVLFYEKIYKPQVEKERACKEMLSISETKRKELEALQEANAKEIERMKDAYNKLMGELEARVSSGDITLSRKGDRIYVTLLEKIMFDSGSAEIKEEGVKVLEQIAEVLNEYEDHDIIVEGHTDNMPIGPSLQKIYPTNWNLAAIRAVNVVRYLEYLGIDPKRLSAASYGEHHPVADNGTEEGRALNRRIEIVLLPTMIEKVEK